MSVYSRHVRSIPRLAAERLAARQARCPHRHILTRSGHDRLIDTCPDCGRLHRTLRLLPLGPDDVMPVAAGEGATFTIPAGPPFFAAGDTAAALVRWADGSTRVVICRIESVITAGYGKPRTIAVRVQTNPEGESR